MKYYSKKQWTHKLTVMVLLAMALGGTAVQAMPSGGDIRSGQGSISQDGKNMTVLQNSDRMAIDWTKFDIAKDETVRYAQPDRNAISLNRVTGGQQSVIAGNLNANGNVVLVNPNGVVFTKNSSVDVGGLVASTACLNDEAMKNFGNGKDSLGLSLDKDSTASVINEGQIKAQGGLVALHAANVENKGTITNEGGTLAMAAAKNLTLSAADDDKLNFTVDGDLAKAQALNSGSLKADGGYVVMTAKSAGDVLSTVVNNSGTIEAKTLRKNEKGQILLDGGNNGQVEASGTLDASGTKAGQDAGNIKVIGQKTIVHDNTNLLAKGDNNGGKIETSGDVLNLGDNLNIDAKGVNGKAGEWLLDPLDVIIADKNNDPTGTDSYSNAEKKTASDSDFTNGSASINYNDPEATTANAASVNSAVTWIYTETVESMLNNGTNVTIQAAATNGNANIIVKNDIDKTAGDDATFTLDAMRNITINGNITSKVGKLKVVLNADSDGDKIGAVIINKDIKTNGGDFISASGGTVKYTSDKNNTKGYGKGTLTGSADPVGHSVGTYFGHVDGSGTADGEKDDRLIQTNGGKITLNGEVAIGLNGGTLTLDSSNASGEKGDITVTGIINSGNSYGAYVYGTTTWDELTAEKVNEYLTSDSVPAYRYQGVNYVKNSDGSYAKNEDGSYKTTTDKADFSKGEPHYTFDKETNTQNIRWLGDGSSTAVSLDKGQGYSSVIITEGKMSTKEYLQYVAVSDPTGFLSRYMTSNPTFTVGSTSYTLTVGSVKVNGVDNNALGYNAGGKFTALTKAQIQNLADSALTLAKNSTDKTTMSNGKTAYTNLTNDIKQLIASNWFVSENLAKYDPKTKTYNEGKSAVGDSYLATITTVLENSLTTPNGQQYLWVGSRGSGVLNKTGSTNNDKLYPYSYWGMPDDPTYQDGMYWVTGPEGEANNGKGTQFYSNAGSDWGTVSLGSDGKTYSYNQGSNVYGYVNWDTWTEKARSTDEKRVDVTRSQPDNSSPFLTVGYGTHGKWDDGAMGGATTVGFVKETNLANSSLKINSGSGEVKLQGDIGKAKALDTLNIESTGAVTIGTDNNNVTDYYHGTVYVDHGLYISGNGVTVGGEIHSGESEETDTYTTLADKYKDSVTIESAGNIEVHGITSNTYDVSNADGTTTTRGGKISLTSTGDSGKITLGAGVDYDGNATAGTLAAASAEKGAVVIDAQGSQGSLVNSTDPKSSAITTGTDGTWQVYVNSPSDYGTSLGSNLKSGTNAQWTARSNDNTTVTTNSSNKPLSNYTDTNSNKFIFQVTPVITISGGNQKKIYGETLTDDDLKKLLTTSVAYTDSNKKTIDVTKFSDNFKEDDYLNYISSLDGKTTGINSISTTSDAAAATATRTVGDEKVKDASGKDTDDYKTASDGNRAFYVFNVDKSNAKALNGYDLETVNGDIEILKRTVKVNENGHITYGSADGITYDTPTAEEATSTTGLKNGDTIGSVTMTPSTAYQTSQGTRHTADAGNYDLTTDGTKTTILNNGKDVSANYDISGSGTLIVDKATLTLDTGSTTKTYGDATGVHDFLTDKQKNYTLSGFVNGDQDSSDTQNTIRSQITSVTNTTKALVDNTHTNNVLDGGNTGYAITTKITQSDDLKNYNVVAKQGNTVTLTPVNLTINGGMTQTYGNTAETVKNPTVMIDGKEVTKLVNGDTLGDVSYAIQSDGNYNNSKGDRKTADAGEYSGEWITIGAVINHGDLTNQLGTEANGNYIVTGKGNINVEKATLTVNAKDITETYGNATGVLKDAKTAYEVTGFANGDDDEAKKNALENQITVKMDATDALKDNNQHTKDVNTEGYNNKVVSAVGNLPNGELSNYTVAVGTPAKVHLTPAEVHLKLNDVSTTYGTAFDTDKYGYDASKLVMSNGDDASVVTNAITNKDISYNNTGAKTDATNKDVKTANAGDDYKLTGTTTKTLNNYKVVVDGAKATVNKANLVVDTTGNTRTYGDVSNVASDVANAASFHLSGSTDKTVNGDTEADILKELGLSTSSDAQVKDDAGKVIKTGNANTNPGYDIKATFNKDLTNYTVSEGTVGKEKIEKAALVVDTKGNTRTYGDVSGVANDVANAASFHLSGSTDATANGDSYDDILKEMNLTTDSKAQIKDDNGTVVKTGNANTNPGYDIKAAFDTELKNYIVSEGDVGKEKIEKATLVVDTKGNTRTYGDVNGVSSDVANAANFHIKGSESTTVNGDTYADILKEMNLSTDSAAQIKDASGNVIKTGNANTNPGYDIKASFDTDLTNYAVEEGTVGKEKIEKATLHLSTGDYTEAYGNAKAVQNDLDKATTVSGEKNGDSLAELTSKIGINNTSGALVSKDWTNDVKYKTDGSLDSYGITTNFNKSLDNYKVVLDKAGTVTLTPKEITIKNTMTQQYGSSDRTYKEATVPEGQLVNGDSISTKDLKFDIKSDGEYAKSLAENQKNSSDAITADAGPYTGELIHTGGGITHADGSDAYKNYKVTVEGDIIVTPAPLTITTKDVTTEYGTVKETTSTATGLVNGDQNYASDISYDYGDYGHGYLDNNTRTNNVGSYGITTKAANTTGDFLKNYTISGGDATLTITPKDVYFHVDGKGSTFDDIIYTVTDPNHPGSRDAINSQLPYGETVTGGYGLGQALPGTPGSKDHYYTVDSTINGTPVYDNNGQGTQVGNYVYHPTGQAVIHFDQPQKPDQTTHYVEGARRPQDKIESALPVFRVDASGVVKQYGTYGIESKNQAVTLSPTGMRMPEPNQPSTQDRKYLTTLKTAHGHGTFRLEYNGVVLRVIPVDPAAEQIVTDGDKMKNVALSEQALHVAYTQMGLDLVNLKGVYIYMAPMSV